MAVIVACKRFGKHQGTWVARMLEKKPPMLVAVALANKMARGIWAMITKGQDYQEPVAKVKA
jgi:transposase